VTRKDHQADDLVQTAHRLEEGGVKVKKVGHQIIVPENPVSKYLFNSTSAAWIWLIVRLYLGYAWLTAGWEKLTIPTWTMEKM
jgi:hypothetical protein